MIFKVIKRKKDLFLIQKTNKRFDFVRYLSEKSSESNESVVSSFTSSPSDETVKRVAKRPVNYLPDHLGQCRKWQHQKPWWKYRYFVNINPLDQIEEQKSEWSETPEYPLLNDNSVVGIAKQIRMEWYNAIKRLPTAQQKEYEICKHYSHLSYLLEPISSQYHSLPLQQFITRTHLISGRMPYAYDQMNVDSILDEGLKQQIIDSICLHLFQTKQRKPSFEMKNSALPLMGFPDQEMRVNQAKQEDTIEDIVSIIRNALHSKYQHLFKLQVKVVSIEIKTNC